MTRQRAKAHYTIASSVLHVALILGLLAGLAPPHPAPFASLPVEGAVSIPNPTGMPQGTQAGADISIIDNAFVPSVITVTVGVTVTWVNNDSVVHQVASGNPVVTPTTTPTATTSPTPTPTATLTPTPPAVTEAVYLPLVIDQGQVQSTAPVGRLVYLPLVENRDQTQATSAPDPEAPLLPARHAPAVPARPDGDEFIEASNLGSGPLQPGETYSQTFGVPGIYPYHDPLYAGMSGQVVVLAPLPVANQVPVVTITSPVEGEVVGVGNIQVTGVVVDDGMVASVLVNDVPAALVGDTFNSTIPLADGNQVIHVVATDDLGAVGMASRTVGVDGDGPRIEVVVPRHRQAVYTRRPFIDLRFADHYSAIAPASLHAWLTAQTGAQTNITGDLAVTAQGAQGTLGQPLAEELVYTLTVSIDDTLGNTGTISTTFYVPAGADSITPPVEPENAGWVSGVVYDSSTCDAHLTTCKPLPGAWVTLAEADEGALQAARAQYLARAGRSAAQLTSVAASVTHPLSGTVVTGPDGFFAFPAAATGRYRVVARKDGYTPGQRMADIVRERSTPTNEIYLTPLDPAETECDLNGCTHTSSDGQIQVDVPAGAVPPGQQATIRTTPLDRVNFLDSGELPPNTLETVAFRFDADGLQEFLDDVELTLDNFLDLPPGTLVPTGRFNPETGEWEDVGEPAQVDPTGQRLVVRMRVPGTLDCNFPGALPPFEFVMTGEDGEPGEGCGPATNPCGSEIVLRSGNLRQEVTLPGVQVLDESMAPAFTYDSRRADPGRVIDIRLGLESVEGLDLGGYVRAELYIEGQKTANFTFAAQELAAGGELGHFRYLWDGRDAQGRRLPPGIYRYALRVQIPYRTQYFAAIDDQFGGPPDFTRPTGVFRDFTDDRWHSGSVLLDADPSDAPFGTGWRLAGRQQLHEDEAGRILIDDGSYNLSEYYFRGKDRLQTTPAAARRAVEAEGLHGMYVEEDGGLHFQPIPAPPPGFATAAMQLAEPFPSPGEAITAPLPAAVPGDERHRLWIPQIAGGSTDTSSTLEQAPAVYTRAALSTEVSGTVDADTTWTVAGSPYILAGSVVVAPGVTLTIDPGVVVMGQSLFGGLQVQGHLEAVGTAEAPITFTSEQDSGPAQWQGLVFDGGTGHLRHVTVRYAGLTNPTGRRANVQVRNVSEGEVRIEHSRILSVDNGSASAVADFGLRVENSRVLVQDTLFSGNGNQAGVDYVLYADGASTVITLTNNVFQDNAAQPLRLPAFPSTERFQHNQFADNGSDMVLIQSPAPIAADMVLPRQPAGLVGYQILGNPTVLPGAALMVQPGTNFFTRISQWDIRGTLLAVGTFEQPILFTSVQDSGPGQWAGLFFDGGQGQLEYATIRHATNAITVRENRVDLYASAVVNNLRGVVVRGSLTQFTARNSDFSDNRDWGIDHFDAVIFSDARYNWWGHESGPFQSTTNPEGQGSRVSSFVHYEPWLLAPPDDEAGIFNRTANDHTVLTYDPDSNTYTRHYPDGTTVYFDTLGRHDFTRDPAGNRVAYTYHTDGAPATMSVLLAGETTPRWTWTFAYTDSGGQLGQSAIQNLN